MRFGYFGWVTLYLAGLVVTEQITQLSYVAVVAAVAVIVIEGLALWGYDRRSHLHLLSGILLGVLLLPVLTSALGFGVWINSLLFIPASLLQLDLGLRRTKRP